MRFDQDSFAKKFSCLGLLPSFEHERTHHPGWAWIPKVRSRACEAIAILLLVGGASSLAWAGDNPPPCDDPWGEEYAGTLGGSFSISNPFGGSSNCPGDTIDITFSDSDSDGGKQRCIGDDAEEHPSTGVTPSNYAYSSDTTITDPNGNNVSFSNSSQGNTGNAFTVEGDQTKTPGTYNISYTRKGTSDDSAVSDPQDSTITGSFTIDDISGSIDCDNDEIVIERGESGYLDFTINNDSNCDEDFHWEITLTSGAAGISTDPPDDTVTISAGGSDGATISIDVGNDVTPDHYDYTITLVSESTGAQLDSYSGTITVPGLKSISMKGRTSGPNFGSSANIACGAIDSDVHKADAKFECVFPLNSSYDFSEQVQLTNADGAPDDNSPASLYINNSEAASGSGSASCSFSSSDADSEGNIYGYLLSSNLKETCQVSSRTSNCSVIFSWDDNSPRKWTYEPLITEDIPMSTSLALSLKNVPISGHSLQFVVASIAGWKWDESVQDWIPFIASSDSDPDIVGICAYFSSNQGGDIVTDAGDGKYSAYLNVPYQDFFYVETIEFDAIDLTVYE